MNHVRSARLHLTSSANSGFINFSPSLDEAIDLTSVSYDHQHIDMIPPAEPSLGIDQRLCQSIAKKANLRH